LVDRFRGLRDNDAITEEFGLTSEIWNAVGIADVPDVKKN
jgi:hypothetical protein